MAIESKPGTGPIPRIPPPPPPPPVETKPADPLAPGPAGQQAAAPVASPKDKQGVEAGSLEKNIGPVGAKPLPPPPPGGPAGPAGAKPGFKYDAPTVASPDSIRAAQDWKPGATGISGTDANKTINETYNKLEKQMAKLTGDPPVANWMTYGKYASREAGEQVRNLELVQKAMGGSADAMRQATQAFMSVDQINQAGHLAGDRLSTNAEKALLSSVMPAEAAAKLAVGTTKDMLATLDTMHKGMVKGNTEIYANIAPAYDAFLKGEAKTPGGGMQSLKDAGYSPGSKLDPQGLVSKAFEKYTEAFKVAKDIPGATGEKRTELIKQRDALMHEGNLHLGAQEQMHILQDKEIFGHESMKSALGSVGGTMKLTDANGTIDLRPDGKNWSDFSTRMGLKEVPASEKDKPGVMAVADKYGADGKEPGPQKYYKVDPSQKGTIAEYFKDGLNGPKAANLINSDPRPVDLPEPTSDAGKATAELTRGIDKRDAAQVAEASTRLIGSAPSAVLHSTGDAARFVGDSSVQAGQANLQRGGVLNTVAGSYQVAQGKVVNAGAAVVDKAADVADYAVDKAARGARGAVNVARSGVQLAGQGVELAGRGVRNVSNFVSNHTPNWLKW